MSVDCLKAEAENKAKTFKDQFKSEIDLKLLSIWFMDCIYFGYSHAYKEFKTEELLSKKKEN